VRSSEFAGNVDALFLILTAQCNSRCSYCYQTARKNRKMTWGVLRAALDLSLASRSRNVSIVFLGGEPLLEFPGIRKAVQYVNRKAPSDKRIQFKISTNGLLIDTTVAEYLDRHRFGVQLSFDGIEKSQNYRQKGSFLLIDRLLDRLKQYHPDLFEQRLRVCMTLIPATIPYFAQSIRYLIDKGIRSIAVSPSILAHPEWSLGKIRALDRQFATVCRESLSHLRATGEVPLQFLRRGDNLEDYPIIRNAMCALPAGTRLAVDVDGQGYGCASLAESCQEIPANFLKSCLAPLRLGDFRDSDFPVRFAAFPEATKQAEIFHDKAKKYSSYGKCSRCRYYSRCSICPISIGLDPDNQDPRRIPDFFCAFNRVALKYRSRFPATVDAASEFSQLFALIQSG
jgi:sulfatase maturation enzyme AslB (radical SAM superfamily)